MKSTVKYTKKNSRDRSRDMAANGFGIAGAEGKVGDGK